jgi:cell surface protein SprA
LKNVSLKTSLPTWDLMMKNIYSLNAFQVNPQEFKLNILYLCNSKFKQKKRKI